jgi:hypothetical protein
MAITAAAGTPDQPILGAATSHNRLKTTYSELSRGAFQQPARALIANSRSRTEIATQQIEFDGMSSQRTVLDPDA